MMGVLPASRGLVADKQLVGASAMHGLATGAVTFF